MMPKILIIDNERAIRNTLREVLELEGYDTGIDLARLLEVSAMLPGLIGHDVPSQLLKAGPRSKLHPAPDYAAQIGQQTS